MNKKILSLIALSLLIGCGKEKSKDSTEAPFVPKELAFTKPTQGQKLTKEQISEAKKLFSTNDKLILPPADLVFASKKMPAEELKQKEESIRTRDADSYQLLKDIQNNCLIERPTTKVEASFPTTGDHSLENLKSDDHYNIESLAGLKGDKCPVRYDVAFALSAKANDVNKSAKTLKASGSMGYKTQAFMINKKYQTLLNSRGIVVDSNVSALAIKQDISNKMMLKFDLSGTYYSLTKDVPYSANVQILADGNDNNKNSNVEMIINMKMTIPNFPLNVDIHTKTDSDSKILLEEYYVNGNSMSKEEFDSLFGKENPAVNSSKTLVKMYKF